MAESGRPQTKSLRAESLRACLWSSLFVGLLFAAVSLLSSSVPGVNEPHYLTKARAFDDPAWCRRDFFLSSANAHYCFFQIVGVLTRWFSLDALAVGGRVVSAMMLGLGWSILRRALGMSATSGYIAASVFAALTLMGSFSGEWLLGGFESKVPAWGFSLAAIGFWIRGEVKKSPGQMTLAGVCCGLACAIHPVVGGWVAVCVCFAGALVLLLSAGRGFSARVRQQQSLELTEPADAQRARVPSILRHLAGSAAGLVCFAFATVLVSLPGLIPALRLVTETSLPQKDRELASFYQVFWRLKHHLDPTELSASQWQYAFCLLSIVAIGTLAVQRHQRRSADTACPQDDTEKGKAMPGVCLLMFFAMSGLVAVLGILIGWHQVPAKEMVGWEWRASLLKFYPFRCFDAMLPITAAFVIARSGAEWIRRSDDRYQNRMSRGIAVTLTGTALALSWGSRESVPAGYDAEQYQEWRIACDWIRNNTPEEALFLTPRESFAFKWFAERAEYVCYKDCPQDASGILTWNRRLWQLHDWTLESSSDQIYGLNDLRALRRLTDCDYVITRILGPFEVPPLWEGRSWRIYAVPEQD